MIAAALCGDGNVSNCKTYVCKLEGWGETFGARREVASTFQSFLLGSHYSSVHKPGERGLEPAARRR
jgi:hypothetical protein